jgi:hypothetical protein
MVPKVGVWNPHPLEESRLHPTGEFDSEAIHVGERFEINCEAGRRARWTGYSSDL